MINDDVYVDLNNVVAIYPSGDLYTIVLHCGHSFAIPVKQGEMVLAEMRSVEQIREAGKNKLMERIADMMKDRENPFNDADFFKH